MHYIVDICTDKTGTLTQNKMTATRAYCPCMDDAVELSAASILKDSKASPYALYNGMPLDLSRATCLVKLFEAGCLCNNSYVSGGTALGLPTEGAILLAAIRLGVPDRRSLLKRVDETPFSSETKMMEVRCVVLAGKEAAFQQLPLFPRIVLASHDSRKGDKNVSGASSVP